MAGTLFVHIGPPKTATTFIQKVLFPKIESLKCIVKPKIRVRDDIIIFGDLFNLSPSVWGEVGSNLFGREDETKEDIIISDEIIFDGFTAPLPWIPEPESDRELPARPRRHTHARPDPYLVARHFQSLYEKASTWGYECVNFLMTIRRQDTKLASDYAQISDRVRGAGQESFERWVQYLTNNVIGYNKGGGVKLDYYLWYKNLSDIIGTDNIFFIPFEVLKDNEKRFIIDFLKYIGVEDCGKIAERVCGKAGENVRSEGDNEWSIRPPGWYGPNLRPTRLFKSAGLPTNIPLRYPDFSRDNKIKLTDGLKKEIMQVYESGNKNLNKYIDEYDLRKYEYY